jgi:hypothetical protein
MTPVTISYQTTRKNPRIHWFFDSLRLQLSEFPDLVKRVIVVDFWHGTRPLPIPDDYPVEIKYVKSMPSVWQGEHRLTKEDWFDACSARNTSICYCDTEWLAYVDDLSVLMPGWMGCVNDAVKGNYIALGTYEKVKHLIVDNGYAVSYEGYHGGKDSRRTLVLGKGVLTCNGDWMYGCSAAIPLEAALVVNGWPVDLTSGCGAEDYVMGIAMGNCGYHFKYDTRMLTLESEEGHHEEPSFRREDFGKSPNDMSHAILATARQSKYFPNSFGEGGIRALRERILSGGEFPIPKSPDRHWFNKKLLSEL